MFEAQEDFHDYAIVIEANHVARKQDALDLFPVYEPPEKELFWNLSRDPLIGERVYFYI